jgi:hypothetical protein
VADKLDGYLGARLREYLNLSYGGRMKARGARESTNVIDARDAPKPEVELKQQTWADRERALRNARRDAAVRDTGAIVRGGDRISNSATVTEIERMIDRARTVTPRDVSRFQAQRLTEMRQALSDQQAAGWGQASVPVQPSRQRVLTRDEAELVRESAASLQRTLEMRRDQLVRGVAQPRKLELPQTQPPAPPPLPRPMPIVATGDYPMDRHDDYLKEMGASDKRTATHKAISRIVGETARGALVGGALAGVPGAVIGGVTFGGIQAVTESPLKSRRERTKDAAVGAGLMAAVNVAVEASMTAKKLRAAQLLKAAVTGGAVGGAAVVVSDTIPRIVETVDRSVSNFDPDKAIASAQKYLKTGVDTVTDNARSFASAVETEAKRRFMLTTVPEKPVKPNQAASDAIDIAPAATFNASRWVAENFPETTAAVLSRFNKSDTAAGVDAMRKVRETANAAKQAFQSVLNGGSDGLKSSLESIKSQAQALKDEITGERAARNRAMIPDRPSAEDLAGRDENIRRSKDPKDTTFRLWDNIMTRSENGQLHPKVERSLDRFMEAFGNNQTTRGMVRARQQQSPLAPAPVQSPRPLSEGSRGNAAAAHDLRTSLNAQAAQTDQKRALEAKNQARVRGETDAKRQANSDFRASVAQRRDDELLPTNQDGDIEVKSYTRKDGTKVRGFKRRKAVA